MRFSANLGFLWADLPLPDAIHAAHKAGFAAVEVHWPYDTPATAVKAALDATGLPLLGLNTRRGDVTAGENGLSALPGREAEARAAIDEALAYAAATGARNVHVMAGRAEGAAARETFIANLTSAAAAAPPGIGLLIEPLNPHDAPRYFLRTVAQAAEIIAAVGAPNLRLMFDCYHVARAEGDVCRRLSDHRDIIGHVQIAGVPDRDRPDRGEISYPFVLNHLSALALPGPVGAEYKPGGPTEPTLGWLEPWSA